MISKSKENEIKKQRNIYYIRMSLLQKREKRKRDQRRH